MAVKSTLGNVNKARGNEERQETPKIERPNLGSLGSKFSTDFGLKTSFSGMDEGGEVFEAMFKEANDMMEKEVRNNEGNPIKFRVLRLMRESRVYYSSLIFCARFGDIVAFRVASFEGTNRAPSPRPIRTQKRPIDLHRTPGQMLNEDLIIKATNLIVDVMGVKEENVFPLESVLILENVDFKDEAVMRRLTSKMFDPPQTELISVVQNFTGVSIEQMRSHGKGSFVVDPIFHEEDYQHFDATGLPQRRDISLDLSYLLKSNRGRYDRYDRYDEKEGDRDVDDRVMLTRTSGYPDFENFQPEEDNNGHIPTQCFAANFIITAVEAAGTTPVTPNMAIMGVLSAVTLSERQSWKRAFVHRRIGTKRDEQDIGLLNIEGRLGAEDRDWGDYYDINKSSKTSKEDRLGRFLNMLVVRRMLISIDVPEAGLETWSLSIFRDIADGDRESKESLYDTIDTMLGFEFDDKGVPMFLNISNDIHGGWYKEDGKVYDIRRACSYLPMVKFALASKDPNIIHTYNDTLHFESPDAIVRANDRLELIKQQVGESLRVKQMYRRITFNGEWIALLVAAFDEAGFTLDTGNGNYDPRSFGETGFNFGKSGVDPSVRISTVRNDDYNFGNDRKRRSRRSRRHTAY